MKVVIVYPTLRNKIKEFFDFFKGSFYKESKMTKRSKNQATPSTQVQPQSSESKPKSIRAKQKKRARSNAAKRAEAL